MKGWWCPYRECLFCQEEFGCSDCEIYLAAVSTLPEPEQSFWLVPTWLQEFEKEAGYTQGGEDE